MPFPRQARLVVGTILACALAVVLASSFGCTSHPETTYQGRKTSQWIRDLRHRDVAKQVAACRALREIGTGAEAAAPKLADLFATSTNATLSSEAGVTLATLGPAGIPSLVKHLRDPVRMERMVYRLQDFNTDAAPLVAPLLDVLEHRTGRPIQFAQGGLVSLARGGDPEVIEEMLRQLQNERLHECSRLSLGAALAWVGADSISAALLPLLDSPDVVTRRAAMEGLVRSETAQLPQQVQYALVLRTREPDPATRIMLARALGECIGPEISETVSLSLLQLAEAPEPVVRYAAGRAMARYGMKGGEKRFDMEQAVDRLRNDPELASYWASRFPELGEYKPYFY